MQVMLGRDIEYIASLTLTWQVKPENAEATSGNGMPG